jgi:sulfur-carrier protein
MMQIQLKYFASVREALGTSSEVVYTQAATLGALRDELLARGGAYSEALAHGKALRMALNHEMQEGNATLLEGCEVAFFPPVTGG